MFIDKVYDKGSWFVEQNNADLDVVIIERIKKRDKQALHDLYMLYGQRLYAYAYRLTGDENQAQDVLQETFITAWKSAGKYRGDGRVLAWLLGITHHQAMKTFRHPMVDLSKVDEKKLDSNQDSPEDLIQASQQKALIRAGLEKLSPDHRAVIELVFYQGLNLEEAAKVCQCPVGTVKSRLSYARLHLKGIINRISMEGKL